LLAGRQPDLNGKTRFGAYTWKMIKANPVTGVGLGAYRSAFPIYTRNDGSLQVSQAHNDYLQILADGGIIGGFLAIWFIVEVFRACAAGLKSRDPWRGLMALGVGAGFFSLLVHSLFDFNLQIPSTALLFLVLAGIVGGVASLRNRAEEENKRRGVQRQRHRREEALAA
ncbi:MAG: O-antigen ligase family protein, partial [Acidobacteriota bacterium]